ncbi:hemerythrin domain-containing protein [Actinomadura coerulea]|uniref:hemerythrin domain-containing protein n=1 Tax=Actinomadura coerulea TaxID=46159 RepID=UPI00342B098C
MDFTMMYIAHDAFNRDLERLLLAADAGKPFTAAAIATWKFFANQLHIHHAAEDASLWPRLHAAVDDADEVRLLREMEAEHASLDPRIDQIDAAVDVRDAAAFTSEIMTLAKGLAAHMAHEEEAALPLLERRLGEAGWDAFGKEIKEQQGGIKGGAAYLPWVLDGVDKPTTTKVLRLLPPPARLVYRKIWEPKYRKSERLHQEDRH